MKRKTRKERIAALHRRTSVRWKLASYMAVFVACVLLITWIFQVFLLESFFKYVKHEELEETADALSAILDDEVLLSAAAFNEARQHSMCVAIYQIRNDEIGKTVLEVDATGSNVILTLHPQQRTYFYRKAVDNGGIYFSSTVGTGGLEIPSDKIFDRFPFQPKDE